MDAPFASSLGSFTNDPLIPMDCVSQPAALPSPVDETDRPYLDMDSEMEPLGSSCVLQALAPSDILIL